MLTAKQVKGHVLHFPWLHRVVPGVLVAGCHSLDCTSMSQMFMSSLYVISGSWLKILATCSLLGHGSDLVESFFDYAFELMSLGKRS